ncbi:Glutamyl-tRNA synthetase [Trachipleistophora hominis]|uniref:Probable glutamate--tRNA ligase, cytoplasmic n=1 Tax=Trachipleistophora hominis TaxID=72359 RepID=L7JW94_TRAHO|nr:Glutamyl-tRNA synthetase [Trachipleistophora hominis]
MQIRLNPADKRCFVFYYLIKKYTQHDVILDKNKKDVDIDVLESLLEGTPVKQFLRKVYSFELELNEALLQFKKETDALKDVYFALLYENGALLKAMKNEKKLEEPATDKNERFSGVLSVLLEDVRNNTIVEQYKKEMKPKETCRFPPEPSGYLHLGHVKAALLNNSMADELIVRFDDTNQEKGSELYEKIILEDLELLELKEHRLSRTSDYYRTIVTCAQYLISEGLAYCDNTDQEQMNKERMEGIQSVKRDTKPVDNMRIFHRMIELGEEEKRGHGSEYEQYCVRAKISVDDKNKALRDPVIFRLKEKKHGRTNSRLSPTYDFACPIVDSVEGVTTVLRTNEFRDRNAQYFWFLNSLKMRVPVIKDFSRLNFENTILSKRKLRTIIEEHDLTWDDPRIPTIRGIMRLGLNINVLKEYIVMQGMRQKNTINSWDKIWAMNKKYLEKTCKRYSGVYGECVKICFVDCKDAPAEPLEAALMIPYNKKDLLMGQRTVFTSNMVISREDAELLADNEEFTLMHIGNVVVRNKQPDKILIMNKPDGDVKTTTNKITWVSLEGAHTVNLAVYGDLVVNGKFNTESKTIIRIHAEKAVEDVKCGEVIQFERIGFARRDYKSGDFIMVPYTEQKRKAGTKK